MKKILLTMALVFSPLTSHLSPLFAQIRINNNADSPLRKLQIAELAISNLYVDSVDEQKLVER